MLRLKLTSLPYSRDHSPKRDSTATSDASLLSRLGGRSGDTLATRPVDSRPGAGRCYAPVQSEGPALGDPLRTSLHCSPEERQEEVDYGLHRDQQVIGGYPLPYGYSQNYPTVGSDPEVQFRGGVGPYQRFPALRDEAGRPGHASNFGPGQSSLPPEVCILRSEADTLPVDKGYESTVTDYPGERDCSVDVHRRRSQSSGVDAPGLPRFDLHAVDVPVPRIHAQLEEDHSPNPAANSSGPSVGYGRLDSSLNARTSQTTSDNSQEGLALASDTDAVGGAVTGDLAVHSRCVNVRPVGIERVTAGVQHGTPAEPELHLDSLVLNDSGGEEKLTPASGLPPPLERQVIPTAFSRRGGEDGRERIRGGRESDEHGVSGSNVDQNSVTLDTEITTRLSSTPLFLDNDTVVVRRSGNSTDGVYSYPGVGSDLHSPVLEDICSRESLVAQDNSGPDRQHGVGMVSRQGRRDQKPGSVIGGRGDAPLGAEEENPALRRAHPRGLERVGGEFATSRVRMPRFRTHATHATLLSDIITIGYGLPNST